MESLPKQSGVISRNKMLDLVTEGLKDLGNEEKTVSPVDLLKYIKHNHNLPLARTLPRFVEALQIAKKRGLVCQANNNKYILNPEPTSMCNTCGGKKKNKDKKSSTRPMRSKQTKSSKRMQSRERRKESLSLRRKAYCRTSSKSKGKSHKSSRRSRTKEKKRMHSLTERSKSRKQNRSQRRHKRHSVSSKRVCRRPRSSKKSSKSEKSKSVRRQRHSKSKRDLSNVRKCPEIEEVVDSSCEEAPNA